MDPLAHVASIDELSQADAAQIEGAERRRVEPDLRRAAGTGDLSGALGLLVDETAPLEVVPALASGGCDEPQSR